MADRGAHAEAEDDRLCWEYLVVGKVAYAEAGSDSELRGAYENTQPDLAVALIDQKCSHSNRAEHVPADESLLQPKEAQKDATRGVGEGFGDSAADVVDEDVALEVFDLEADLVVAE